MEWEFYYWSFVAADVHRVKEGKKWLLQILGKWDIEHGILTERRQHKDGTNNMTGFRLPLGSFCGIWCVFCGGWTGNAGAARDARRSTPWHHQPLRGQVSKVLPTWYYLPAIFLYLSFSEFGEIVSEIFHLFGGPHHVWIVNIPRTVYLHSSTPMFREMDHKIIQ